ncbi:GDSL-type esterase/lipase family protein [Euzebya tangerina]|uniref:GDSL-type esterase/lipase family protein n=1 Tax=Euzebya tangerina TaxID=591198 RepID=UPI000E30CE1F|nr:GDSL-type esterase/lipase family protein [Euzebya tangerina]
MAYAPDSILPNGFLFNPDSHFISSLIMEPKYGDGLRVARANDLTEFWRADYYEQQGHISVVTPESGWREETPEQKRSRKDRFLEECEAVLAAGVPISIAPEGTITQEESTTERSPGPLRPGAFLMSARFNSSPRIVPVALANFDKPAHEAFFACVIKPAFTMEERGVDVDDPATLRTFLKEYRSEFRGYVAEAAALAEEVRQSTSTSPEIITNRDAVSAVDDEFEIDVRALELQPSQQKSSRPKTVFYGSSTFRLWDTLQTDLGLPGALNLGFGGSTVAACHSYFDRLVVPHRPDRVVLYVGENDVARGVSPEDVSQQIARFADMAERTLPDTTFMFVSLKPTPDRSDRVAAVRRTNELIARDVASRERWTYVDWFTYLIGTSGDVSSSLFAADGVHLNRGGYGVLSRVLRDALNPV